MNRLVVPYPPPNRPSAAAEDKADKFLTRLLKYIPTEVVAGYLFFQGIVEGVSPDDKLRLIACWAVFFLGAVLTYVYLRRVGQETPTKKQNLVISVVAFVLWAYALGGPFKLGPPPFPDGHYRPWLGAVVAGAFSWVLGLIKLREPPDTERTGTDSSSAVLPGEGGNTTDRGT